MTQKFKILQIIPDMHTGGAEKTTLDIGAALVAQGWTSHVSSAGGRMVDALCAAGSHHTTLPLNSKNPLTIWRNAKRLETLIKAKNIDLIHARSRAPAWSALLAAKRTGIPFVTTYHGAYNEGTKIKAFYNSVMARADTVIANSHWTADLIRSRNPWAHEKITVIHRGTNFDEFDKNTISTDRTNQLREAWGVSETQTVILHLARITGWKGQNILIDAAAQVVGDFPNLKFVLAGDAQGRENYLSQLKQQITDHGLEKNVCLPGHCSDAAAAMALADIVVVASTEAEAFGRAAVEASALEKALVVTRIGAVGETVLATPDVEDGKHTGWKVPPGDSDALAAALVTVLNMDQAQRHEVGLRARHYSMESFSLKQMCEKTIAVYQKLLQKPS